MKASKMIIPTLKEAPAEAIIDSHILMLRAGFMKKLVSGVYNYLPMGLRSLRKIENIIREEMDKAGGQEILSSAIQPKELWEESGRWYKYGPELMRFKDRHDREYCLGPTHEEIFTDLVKSTVKSYKALPLNLYQIQTKYRDEMRPRFGLMRGREFIMKDAYSFDVDEKGLNQSYDIMYQCYSDIFTRLGINFRVVLADTGAIGGNGSHQFMAISSVGESNIIYCDDCKYAADEEKASSRCVEIIKDKQLLEMKEVATGNAHSCEEVATLLNVPLAKVVKTMIYYAADSNKFGAFMTRGDCELNEIKVANALKTSEAFLRLATDDETKNLGLFVGAIGAINMNKDVELFVDDEVVKLTNFVMGANKKDTHLVNVNYGRDFQGTVVELKKSKAGDLCPMCGKLLKSERGIEVGQIFKLQTKYSASMDCTYLDENGVTKPMVMGCYGIGVTRTFAALVEQYHDENGIKLPINVAPYHAVVVPVNYDDPSQKALADKIYQTLLNQKVEVIEDDRPLKPGFKFKDWELIGIPNIIIVGKRANEDIVEYKDRSVNTKVEMSSENAISEVMKMVESIR